MLQDLHLDGLPGPTTFHGGLSSGNLASQANAGAPSHPRAAARQCLAKMRQVLALGIPQGFLPPLPRPELELLRSCGFRGNDAHILERAALEEPQLLRISCSNAFMWTANCATVIPSEDASDGYCHLITANLSAMPHRALEAQARHAMLRHVFSEGQRFMVHPPLPGALGDEGAANHHRAHGAQGSAHLFVHGRTLGASAQEPGRFIARQCREASTAVARLGCAKTALFARQSPHAIDQGAFHNDVVMVGSGARLALHEHALCDQDEVLARLRGSCGQLQIQVIGENELPLAEAVRSYLFNSQLLDTAQGAVLLAPIEASAGRSRALLERLAGTGFISRFEFVDLRESMMGGGGPACLRLRVPVNAVELAAVDRAFLLDEERLRVLEQWVDRHYRLSLSLGDLRDPELLRESHEALEELTRLCGFGALYRFQGGVV